MSCSKLYNDYDGLTHDYRNKHGLVYEKIYLPKYAPPEWQDRNTLWNAVEAAEKAKNSRLAREIIVALPVEFGEQEWKTILDDFIEHNFVNRGMCADVCIHNTDGHNPHAHIMLTVRPLNKNGKWQSKTQKEYICIRNGIEKPMTASEYKYFQTCGWEKQYLYTDGQEECYLPPSRAKGFERVDKHPKSTRYGRQNPITADWNSEQTLCKWRENWAKTVNHYLHYIDENLSIDHRSYAVRGIKKQPTAHVGAVGMILMRQKKYSARFDINRLIRADNQWIDDWVEAITTLTKLVILSVFKLAEALESAKENLVVLFFEKERLKLAYNHSEYISSEYRKTIQKISILNDEIKTAENEVAMLEKQSKKLFIKPSTKAEIHERISELTNEIEDLKSQKQMYLNRIGCKTDADIPSAEKRVSEKQSNMDKIREKQKTNGKSIETTLEKFRELKARSEESDPQEVEKERVKMRIQKEDAAIDRIEEMFGSVSDSEINEAFDNAEKAIGEWNPPKKKEEELETEIYENYEEEKEQEPEKAEPTHRTRDDFDER